MVDYRRFDNINYDSDEAESKPLGANSRPPQQMTRKGKENRFKFEHEGRLIYEWEQSLDEASS